MKVSPPDQHFYDEKLDIEVAHAAKAPEGPSSATRRGPHEAVRRKTALVTGANSGIGRAVAERSGRRGARDPSGASRTWRAVVKARPLERRLGAVRARRVAEAGRRQAAASRRKRAGSTSSSTTRGCSRSVPPRAHRGGRSTSPFAVTSKARSPDGRDRAADRRSRGGVSSTSRRWWRVRYATALPYLRASEAAVELLTKAWTTTDASGDSG